MFSEADLERMAVLAELATPGPMKVQVSEHVRDGALSSSIFVIKSKATSLLKMNGPCLMYKNAQCDAEFIAAAYSFIPEAVEMLRDYLKMLSGKDEEED